MSLTEIIAVIFSLACIWLAVKKHPLNWPVGLVGVAAYMLLFWQVKLYADMLLQLVFIAQGIYGWYNWRKRKDDETGVQVSYLDNRQRLLYAALILLVTSAWSSVLVRYTDASTPYVDAFVATLSLVANWLMAQKKSDNWILWILADAIYVGLFWYKELYLSSGIYVIFLILASKGLNDWNQKSDTKKASS
jgi:nicotinamide mononucleotide transporter